MEQKTRPARESSATDVALLVSLLSTSTAAHHGDRELDRLGTLARAQDWLTQTLRAVADTSDTRAPSIALHRADLQPLRAFRESLRAALRAGHPACDDHGDDDHSTDFATTVELRWSPAAGISARPLSSGWQAVAALVMTELLRAEADGTLRRVKTCAYDVCGFPFIDRSRNNSRVWHDTSRCGNLVNLRAARARNASTTARP